MKLRVLLLLLWAGSNAYAQTYTATIDSVNEAITFSAANLMPKVDPAFELYIHDTTGIQGVHIRLGNTDGAGDILDQNYTLTQAPLLTDSATGKTHYHVDTGLFPFAPPFVQAWLLFVDGTVSAISDEQLVF